MGKLIQGIFSAVLLLAALVAQLALCAPGVEDNEVGTVKSAFALLDNRTFWDSIRGITRKDCEVNLDDWTPPFNISNKFAYYLSGFDETERPIWIVEAGKIDLRSEIEAGDEHAKAIELYTRQACYRIFQHAAKTEEFPEGEGLMIIDAAGLDIRQVYSPQTVAFGLRIALMYRDLFIKFCGGAVIINANYITTLLASVARQIFGAAFERVSVFGNNKEKWLPELLKRFPRDQLPPWYGGKQVWKPVKVFG